MLSPFRRLLPASREHELELRASFLSKWQVRTRYEYVAVHTMSGLAAYSTALAAYAHPLLWALLHIRSFVGPQPNGPILK